MALVTEEKVNAFERDGVVLLQRAFEPLGSIGWRRPLTR